ncbi:hypothetical protein ABZS61_20300 [Streptomyces sp. NPDC005566]|uniref:hypothetical protein n=1 Tax=Streptomyces sp. NPDC005566 TaxID=3156886 RepID=UPI0033A935A9
MTGTADSAAERNTAGAARREIPSGRGGRDHCGRKAAVVGPPGMIVSYGDASFVRAGTAGTGRLFGAEFWLTAVIFAGLRLQRWTQDDGRRVALFVQGALLVGAVAGPVLLFHGALAVAVAMAVLGCRRQSSPGRSASTSVAGAPEFTAGNAPVTAPS